MKVRAAEDRDVTRLAAGMKEVADEGRWLATEPTATPGELAERFRSAIRDGHILLVLEEGGEIVGSIGVHPTAAPGVLSLGMWILPRWRGRGGGRMLLRAALEESRGGDAHKLELEVFPDNEAAISLYASEGFEVEGLRRRHYRRWDGSIRSALIMALLLDEGESAGGTAR